jgi:hypothetical protein
MRWLPGSAARTEREAQTPYRQASTPHAMAKSTVAYMEDFPTRIRQEIESPDATHAPARAHAAARGREGAGKMPEAGPFRNCTKRGAPA